MATTPMVFSSIRATTSSGLITYRPCCTGM